MPYVKFVDSDGTPFYFEVVGSGTTGDPYVPVSEVGINGAPISAANPLITTLGDLCEAVKNLFRIMARPLWVDPTTSRVKGDVTVSSGTVTTVTTVTACTTLNQLGGMDAKQTLLYSQDRSTWSNSVRSRIT